MNKTLACCATTTFVLTIVAVVESVPYVRGIAYEDVRIFAACFVVVVGVILLAGSFRILVEAVCCDDDRYVARNEDRAVAVEEAEEESKV